MWRGKIQTEIERSRGEGQKEGKQMDQERGRHCERKGEGGMDERTMRRDESKKGKDEKRRFCKASELIDLI